MQVIEKFMSLNPVVRGIVSFGILIVIIVILMALYYIIKIIFFRKEIKLLLKLKKAKNIYEMSHTYKCSRNKVGIIALILCITFLSVCIYLLINNVLARAICMTLILLGGVMEFYGKPKTIKIEDDKLIIKRRLKTKIEYKLKDIQDIKFYEEYVIESTETIINRNRNFYLQHKKKIYIKGNRDFQEYNVIWLNFNTVEVLIYLIFYIKNNELDKIDGLSEDDMMKLEKIHRLQRKRRWNISRGRR